MHYTVMQLGHVLDVTQRTEDVRTPGRGRGRGRGRGGAGEARGHTAGRDPLRRRPTVRPSSTAQAPSSWTAELRPVSYAEFAAVYTCAPLAPEYAVHVRPPP